MKKLILMAIGLGFVIGCSTPEQKRVWIKPPNGWENSQARYQKIYYQVDDAKTGKRERIMIPLNETPEQLVISDPKMQDASLSNQVLATEADQVLKQASAQDPAARAQVSYLAGIQKVEDLYRQGDYSKALIHIAPLIKDYPKKSRLFAMQGTLYRQIGEPKMAIGAYTQAKNLEPKNLRYAEVIDDLQMELEGGIQ